MPGKLLEPSTQKPVWWKRKVGIEKAGRCVFGMKMIMRADHVASHAFSQWGAITARSQWYSMVRPCLCQGHSTCFVRKERRAGTQL